MRPLTENEKDRLWEKVRKEFPDDEAMQEVHFVRLMHYEQTKGLSLAERLAFFQPSTDTPPVPVRPSS